MKEKLMNHKNITNNVEAIFDTSITAKQVSKDALSVPISKAIEKMATAFKQGHKVLSCGNGGSAADAQHFAAELVCRFERERPALAAIALTVDTSALTAISNDYHYDEVFARQIDALAKPHDILLAISTSGFSPNVVRAIEQAHEHQMTVVALTGRDGGKIAKILNEDDIEIRVPSESTARIQEVHLLTIHCLCDQIDEMLFPNGN
jgi:D-sedoheptulose 7-phosphate isomerase